MEENVKKSSPMAIASLTLGIVSLCTTIFWYMSIPTSIIAIVFGAKTTKKLQSKLGKAGLITGIVGLCLTIFLYAIVSIIIVAHEYF